MSRATARVLVRGWGIPTALAVVVLTVAAALAAPDSLPLPRLFGYHELAAPTGAVAALGLALAAIAAAREPVPQLLGTADARRQAANPARILLVCAAGAALLCLVAGADGRHVVIALAALTGEGLLVASVAGLSTAWSLPVMHVLAALVLGGAAGQELAWWAWIIGTDPGPGSWIASLAVAILGTGAWMLRLRHPC